MANNQNNYCACSGTDAQFNIRLNQQGPPGAKGEQGVKGIDGISPVISVDTDTVFQYKLKISQPGNTFVTPNLKGDTKVDIEPWTLSTPNKIPTFTLNTTLTNDNLNGDNVAELFSGLGFSINITDNITGTHTIRNNYTFPLVTIIKQNGVITGVQTYNLLSTQGLKAGDGIKIVDSDDIQVTISTDDNYIKGLIDDNQPDLSHYTRDNVATTITSNWNFEGGLKSNSLLSLDNKYLLSRIGTNTLAIGDSTTPLRLTASTNPTVLIGNTDTYQLIHSGNVNTYVTPTPVATTETLGKVKPDGTTITISDGTISAVTDPGGTIQTQINGLQTQVSANKSSITTLETEVADKQDKLIAGDNITIVDNVISSTGGGGGEGTSDYTQLVNKPRINGVELEGDKSTTDLNIDIPDVSNLATKDELQEGLDNKQDKLTTTQLNAVNSGITLAKVTSYDEALTTIQTLQNTINDLTARLEALETNINGGNA